MSVEPLESIRHVLSGLWERWEAYKSLRNEKASLRHLLSLELRRNLALLGAVRLDDGEQDGPALRAIAAELETDILEQVFAPTKAAADVRKELDQAEEPKPSEDDGPTTKSLLMNLYVRVTAVQKLAALPADLGGLRKIQFRTRLRHVAETYRALVARVDVE
jgi:hypothetical protein